MWVPKKEYMDLLKAKAANHDLQCDLTFWKAKYEALEQDKATVVGDKNGESVLVISMSALEKANQDTREQLFKMDQIKQELEKYRQLYADEVQKRLDLISKIGMIEIGGTRNEVQ